MSDTQQAIQKLIDDNAVVLFMKGTATFPQCGFSSRSSAALTECGVEFSFINVLAEPEVRANLHRYADWPTFPQLYIDSELVGGCDIVMELYENGELKKMVEQAGK